MDKQGTFRHCPVVRVSGGGESACCRKHRAAIAPTTLLANPRIGERLEEFEPRDVRRIHVGHYEMRYEIVDSTTYLLRLWHTREDR